MRDQELGVASIAKGDRPQGQSGVAANLSGIVRVVCYASVNAPAGYEAVAHLWLDGERLPIVFNATSTEAAERKAFAHWDAEMAKHGASIARRAEGRQKAAETRARKGLISPPQNEAREAEDEPQQNSADPQP